MSIAKRLKRRMPTVIAVIVLLAVWETWVDLGHVSPTMISAPSEIFAAAVETWNTLGPAAAITGYEGVVGFLFAVFFGIIDRHCTVLLAHVQRGVLSAACRRTNHAADFHRPVVPDLVRF